jgi:hypothetical protein
MGPREHANPREHAGLPTFPNLGMTIPLPPPDPLHLGDSREGRPVQGWRFGSGDFRISLIGGCHADEPIGPALLRRLVSFLHARPPGHPAVTGLEWWIVPDANPDGAVRNAAWTEAIAGAVDPLAYVRHVHREPPGDDVEFGFPLDAADAGARPENRALFEWWRTADGPFALHASLHGMAVAEGPWFLIEASWADRSAGLQAACAAETAALGYRLHDVDRKGEKGFRRIGPGFTTRPDSREMIRHFRERGDEATAALFRPSSTETIVALGGDPLTLVSEMPLFVLPARPGEGPSGSGEVQEWKRRLARWQGMAAAEAAVREEIAASGLVPMPVHDQMRLQWTFVREGIACVRDTRRPGA